VPLRLYYCDHHEIPLPAGHRFPAEKYSLLRRQLERDARFELVTAPAATVGAIELAHDPAYVAAFLNGTLPAQAMRRIGFPWSPGLVARTLHSAGSTLAAATDALTCGIGGGLAGGTHHALRAEGAGFCVFNDIAIAIRVLQRDGRIARAAVIDLDVHQGDGTAGIFEADPAVLTLSLHGANNFPFRKQRSSIDVEFPDGTGDEVWLQALESALPRVWAFAPDIVFFQSGVDTLASDCLGRLALSPEGLRERDRLVLHGAANRGYPLVITLGGGYSDPIQLTIDAHASTFRAASSVLETCI
jgi:acetoin utilization deacetylase AcuC-like enzyme